MLEKSPGYDWFVGYQFEGEKPEEISVFGQIKIEDAIREARYSLDGIGNMNAGTYSLLYARRGDFDVSRS